MDRGRRGSWIWSGAAEDLEGPEPSLRESDEDSERRTMCDLSITLTYTTMDLALLYTALRSALTITSKYVGSKVQEIDALFLLT